MHANVANLEDNCLPEVVAIDGKTSRRSGKVGATPLPRVSAFDAVPGKTPHPFHKVVEKDQGRLEVWRCRVFDQLDCLHAPERWPDLKSFARVTSERTDQLP